MTPEFLTQNPPQSWDEMVQAMLRCEQTASQTVYQHGQSVYKHFIKLVDHLKGDCLSDDQWRLPDWLGVYKAQLLSSLHSESKIEQYTLYHDCGKPYCRITDKESGQNRFPNHEEVSSYIWAMVGGDEDVRRLIANDMAIHTSTAAEIDQKLKSCWSREDSVTLLLAALAEIHSNSKMFGGIESTSFKMKWKAVDKRGKQICKFWFPSES